MRAMAGFFDANQMIIMINVPRPHSTASTIGQICHVLLRLPACVNAQSGYLPASTATTMPNPIHRAQNTNEIGRKISAASTVVSLAPPGPFDAHCR
jgi:hypothetical protein